MANFYIDVSNNSDGSSAEQCAYDSVPYVGSETRVYVCPDGIYGRYVRVRYATNKQDYLQLCEVQVQGRGRYCRAIKDKYEWRKLKCLSLFIINVTMGNIEANGL